MSYHYQYSIVPLMGCVYQKWKCTLPYLSSIEVLYLYFTCNLRIIDERKLYFSFDSNCFNQAREVGIEQPSLNVTDSNTITRTCNGQVGESDTQLLAEIGSVTSKKKLYYISETFLKSKLIHQCNKFQNKCTSSLSVQLSLENMNCNHHCVRRMSILFTADNGALSMFAGVYWTFQSNIKTTVYTQKRLDNIEGERFHQKFQQNTVQYYESTLTVSRRCIWQQIK